MPPRIGGEVVFVGVESPPVRRKAEGWFVGERSATMSAIVEPNPQMSGAGVPAGGLGFRIPYRLPRLER